MILLQCRMGKSFTVNPSLAPLNTLTSWLIGPQSIPLSYIKINVVSALCYCLIKEIYMDFKYRFSLVGSGEKWQRGGVCEPVCMCTFLFVSQLNGAVEINDPAMCFIFPLSTESGRRVLGLPSISLWPQSFTGSSSLPAS